MSSNLVSILIPSYNSECWLAETLQSAIGQTWADKEIILVDDGSTDRSLEIANSFASPTVKIISQKHNGASSARNRALHEAQGDFIQYLDADDLLASDKIECQIQLIKQGYTDYVMSGQWRRFYDALTEDNFCPELVWNDMSPVDWLVCSWQGGGMMPLHAWLVPRHISNAAGFWNECLSLNDDGEYFCRVLLASKGIKFCRDAKSYYRSGNFNSLSSSISRKARESEFLSWSIVTSNLLAVENNLRTRQVCANVFQRFVYDVYPDVADLRQKALSKVQQLGGSNLKPTGSPSFNLLASIVGWKSARRMQAFLYRYGYKKIAVGNKLSKLAQRIKLMLI
jgi:glycosyltransferase involved in cell wall biosynthesis